MAASALMECSAGAQAPGTSAWCWQGVGAGLLPRPPAPTHGPPRPAAEPLPPDVCFGSLPVSSNTAVAWGLPEPLKLQAALV